MVEIGVCTIPELLIRASGLCCRDFSLISEIKLVAVVVCREKGDAMLMAIAMRVLFSTASLVCNFHWA